MVAIMIKEKYVAITGSDGFVGRHLVNEFKSNNVSVLELDINNGIDITDWDQIKEIEHFDILFHLAAKTFVPESFRIPREFYRVNITGTLNALELCRTRNAKMIYASTYVYGRPKYLPIDENHPLFGGHPYVQSKIIGEQLCRSYHEDFNVKVIVLRPFNIYGPGQNDRFLIPTIFNQVKKGEVTLKDPNPKRDFICVSDMVTAYLKAAEYDRKDFNIFNIASGNSYSGACFKVS